MKDIKRFDCVDTQAYKAGVMAECDLGDYVRIEDYFDLQDELEQAKQLIESFQTEIKVLRDNSASRF